MTKERRELLWKKLLACPFYPQLGLDARGKRAERGIPWWRMRMRRNFSLWANVVETLLRKQFEVHHESVDESVLKCVMWEEITGQDMQNNPVWLLHYWMGWEWKGLLSAVELHQPAVNNT